MSAEETWQLCERCRLLNVMHKKKTRIAILMKDHQQVSDKFAEFLKLRRRVEILKIACQEEKQSIQEKKNEYQMLRRVNEKRESRLHRAQQTDFSQKLYRTQEEASKRQQDFDKEAKELMNMRREYITHMMKLVHPIAIDKVDPKKGKEPIIGDELIVEEEDYLMLGGFSTLPPHPSCLTRIGYGALPADGDVASLYNRRQEAQRSTEEGSDLLADPCAAITAAIAHVIHSVSVIGKILSQPLPHPMSLPVALCDHGHPDKKVKRVVRTFAKLHDNTLFLCFSQGVDPSSLQTGNVLSNLLVLVNHPQLGRTGPFSCYPELLWHSKKTFRSREQSSSHVYWESEPPMLHLAATSPHIMTFSSASSESEEDDVLPDHSEHPLLDSVGDGWEEIKDSRLATNDRLEYDTSYPDYTTPLWGGEEGANIQSSTSSGLLETIGSLLASGFRTRK